MSRGYLVLVVVAFILLSLLVTGAARAELNSVEVVHGIIEVGLDALTSITIIKDLGEALDAELTGDWILVVRTNSVLDVYRITRLDLKLVKSYMLDCESMSVEEINEAVIVWCGMERLYYFDPSNGELRGPIMLPSPYRGIVVVDNELYVATPSKLYHYSLISMDLREILDLKSIGLRGEIVKLKPIVGDEAVLLLLRGDDGSERAVILTQQLKPKTSIKLPSEVIDITAYRDNDAWILVYLEKINETHGVKLVVQRMNLDGLGIESSSLTLPVNATNLKQSNLPGWLIAYAHNRFTLVELVDGYAVIRGTYAVAELKDYEPLVLVEDKVYLVTYFAGYLNLVDISTSDMLWGPRGIKVASLSQLEASSKLLLLLGNGNLKAIVVSDQVLQHLYPVEIIAYQLKIDGKSYSPSLVLEGLTNEARLSVRNGSRILLPLGAYKLVIDYELYQEDIVFNHLAPGTIINVEPKTVDYLICISQWATPVRVVVTRNNHVVLNVSATSRCVDLELPPSIYTVKIYAEGFKEYRLTLTPLTKNYTVHMEPLTGRILVKVYDAITGKPIPWARIIIRSLGVSNISISWIPFHPLELPIGMYAVRIEAPNYRVEELNVSINVDDLRLVNVHLTPPVTRLLVVDELSGTLIRNFFVEVDGFSIYGDRIVRRINGSGVAFLALPPGVYKVKISAPMYEEKVMEIFAPGGVYQVSLRLAMVKASTPLELAFRILTPILVLAILALLVMKHRRKLTKIREKKPRLPRPKRRREEEELYEKLAEELFRIRVGEKHEI